MRSLVAAAGFALLLLGSGFTSAQVAVDVGLAQPTTSQVTVQTSSSLLQSVVTAPPPVQAPLQAPSSIDSASSAAGSPEIAPQVQLPAAEASFEAASVPLVTEIPPVVEVTHPLDGSEELATLPEPPTLLDVLSLELGAAQEAAVPSSLGEQDSLLEVRAASESAQLRAAEMALIDLVNRDRFDYALAPVTFEPRLLEIARQRAASQADTQILTHEGGDGALVFAGLLADARVSYRLAGENLARVRGADATSMQRAESALMESPSHRANILEPTFNRVAVGAARDSRGRVVLAQIFLAS